MKNNKKIFAIIIIVIIVAFILVGTGIFLDSNKNSCASSKREAINVIKKKYGDLKYEFISHEKNVYKFKVKFDTRTKFFDLNTESCEIKDSFKYNDELYPDYK